MAGASLVAKRLRLQAPNAGGRCSIPGQGARSHIQELIPSAAKKKKGYGFPGGAVIKNLPANAGDAGEMVSISGLERSHGVGNAPGKFHGQRRLEGYSPWRHKMSEDWDFPGGPVAKTLRSPIAHV